MGAGIAWLVTLAADAAPTAPPAAPGDGGGATGGGMNMFIMLGIILVVMYFFVFGPQRKKEKQRRQMLEALAKDDNVVTIGGIHGTVWQIKDQEVVLTVADNAKMTFSRGAIARVLRDGEEPVK